MTTRTWLIALTSLGVLSVACATAEEPAAGDSSPSVQVPAPADETTSSTLPMSVPDTPATTPDTAPERPDPDPSRQLAPDFSLELANGSTFVLSEETRPVFMVFWAEW